jgi:hypothetical protein
MRNGFFSHFPAEQDCPAFHFTGEVEEADVDIFHLYTDGIDLSESVLRTLFSFRALGLAAGDGYDIDVRAAVQKDAMAELLHLGFYFFHQLFAAYGVAQKRLKHGKEHLRFIESKGAGGHFFFTYSTACGSVARGNSQIALRSGNCALQAYERHARPASNVVFHLDLVDQCAGPLVDG